MVHRRKLIAGALLPALGFSFSLAANAAGTDAKSAATGQSAPAAATGAAKTTASMAAADVRASKLIGTNVTNDRNERLGEIKDLVVDAANGKVDYAVVSFGGFLGMGDKLFAYPLDRFRWDSTQDKLLLNVDKEKLKAAPGFDPKQWPDFHKGTYRADLDRYFDAKARRDAGPAPRFVRVSEMLKGDVKDAQRKDIGDIEDLVVNMQNAKVHYVVVDFDKAWTPDDKLVAMPMRALRSEDRDGSDLVYPATPDELRAAPSFEKSRWPDASDQKFRADVDRYDQTWMNRPDSIGQAVRK